MDANSNNIANDIHSHSNNLHNHRRMKWYTEIRKVDLETGELLTDSQIERENWIRTNKIDVNKQHCGHYKLKTITYEYRKNRQHRLEL